MPQTITAPKESFLTTGLRGAVGHGVELLNFTPEPDEGAYPQDAIFGSDPLDPQNRWGGGFVAEGYSCDAIATIDPTCAVPSKEKPTSNSALYVTQAAQPFGLHASVRCSTFANGFFPENMLDGFRRAARQKLFSCQWQQIAYELWTGAAAQEYGFTENRWLTKPAAPGVAGTVDLTPGTGAVSIVEGLASIEDALKHCSCGTPDLIHVPVKMVPYLAQASQLRTRGDRLFTFNGSLVIADPGYDGTGIGGIPPMPGEWWIYGTSSITARLGETFTPELGFGDAFSRKTNDFEVRAERLAGLAWTCCSVGIRVKEC